MRLGRNPLARLDTSQPKAVACVVTHLPHEFGYHEKRFDIIRLCLTTMREQAGQRVAVYVWDNGSCEKLVRWLMDEYKPEYLTLAPNVGKITARAAMLKSFIPGTPVAYSDDDMFFDQGWFTKSLEVLQAFPNVGLVTAYPCRAMFRNASNTARAWADAEGILDVGQYIPPEWEEDYAKSCGYIVSDHMNAINQEQDYRATYNGVSAYLTGHHCQFVTLAGVLDDCLIPDNLAMSDERPTDKMIDNAGLLRLATTERLARHMGNYPDAWIQQEISKWL